MGIINLIIQFLRVQLPLGIQVMLQLQEVQGPLPFHQLFLVLQVPIPLRLIVYSQRQVVAITMKMQQLLLPYKQLQMQVLLQGLLRYVLLL